MLNEDFNILHYIFEEIIGDNKRKILEGEPKNLLTFIRECKNIIEDN